MTITYQAGSGGGGGSNASVGTNNITAPTSSTEVGFIDGTGKLQGISASNPLPVTGGTITYTDGAASPTHPVAPSLVAVYNTAAPAPAAGQWVVLQADSQGDLKIYNAALQAGEALPGNVQGDATINSVRTGATIIGAVYNTTNPTVTNGQVAANQSDEVGNLKVVQKAAVSAITSVSGSATTVSLLASNIARKNAVFYNDSTATAYIAFAASATTTTYTVQVPSQGFFEMPGPSIYTGAISCIWSAANGAMRITEIS